ncbi:sensor histidine kinase [Niastella sp. OAS944]|uniref:sensor histidine kinase n=1 Tax=Niastella sp. OAS944 TaxID=2664089 RepID=UPI003473BFEB
MPFSLNLRLPQINKNQVLYHIGGWFFFIFYEVSFVAIILGAKGQRGILPDYVVPYLINICLFYFHAHVALSSSFNDNKKRYFAFTGLLIAELAIYLYLLILTGILKDPNAYTHPSIWFQNNNPMTLLRQMWRGIYFIAFSSAYWFAIKTITLQRKILLFEKIQLQNQVDKNNLEKNIIELQNAYLQSQINPHLLFNTLNFVYTNVESVSREAAEAVILLSELMNFSLKEPEADGMVNLETEVEQIKNIIKINQIRFDNRLAIDVKFNGEFSDARIIPIGLLPFIENFFKHGNLTDKDYPGKIIVNYNGESVELITLNRKKVRNKAYSHGIGLINVRKRLDNLYKDRYTLTTNNEGQDYYLHLTIKLKSECHA